MKITIVLIAALILFAIAISLVDTLYIEGAYLNINESKLVMANNSSNENSHAIVNFFHSAEKVDLTSVALKVIALFSGFLILKNILPKSKFLTSILSRFKK